MDIKQEPSRQPSAMKQEQIKTEPLRIKSAMRDPSRGRAKSKVRFVDVVVKTEDTQSSLKTIPDTQVILSQSVSQVKEEPKQIKTQDE